MVVALEDSLIQRQCDAAPKSIGPVVEKQAAFVREMMNVGRSAMPYRKWNNLTATLHPYARAVPHNGGTAYVEGFRLDMKVVEGERDNVLVPRHYMPADFGYTNIAALKSDLLSQLDRARIPTTDETVYRRPHSAAVAYELAGAGR